MQFRAKKAFQFFFKTMSILKYYKVNLISSRIIWALILLQILKKKWINTKLIIKSKNAVANHPPSATPNNANVMEVTWIFNAISIVNADQRANNIYNNNKSNQNNIRKNKELIIALIIRSAMELIKNYKFALYPNKKVLVYSFCKTWKKDNI